MQKLSICVGQGQEQGLGQGVGVKGGQGGSSQVTAADILLWGRDGGVWGWGNDGGEEGGGERL